MLKVRSVAAAVQLTFSHLSTVTQAEGVGPIRRKGGSETRPGRPDRLVSVCVVGEDVGGRPWAFNHAAGRRLVFHITIAVTK
jgi:hypothetical protein